MSSIQEAAMIRTSLALVLVALVAATAAPAYAKGSSSKKNNGGGSSAPTTPDPAPSREDEAVAYLMNLDNTKYKLSDEDAVSNVRKLLGYWKDETLSAGTKSKAVKLLDWFAHHKDTPVVVAAVAALGEVGKGPGTTKLVMLLDGLMMQKPAPADRVAAVLGALRTAADPDPEITRSIMKTMVDGDGPIATKAADCLGNYGGATVEVKRRLFEEMLVNFETMAAAATKPENAPAVDKWKALSFPAAAALGSLSKQSFADVAAARKWLAEKGRDPAAWK
jgi:hypothetical protein